MSNGSRTQRPATAAGTLGVAVVGCGLIGRRRAAAAAAHPHCVLRALADTAPAATADLAGYACDTTRDWQELIARPDIDIVVASTPNALLAEIAIAALGAGRHVLIEKPMGRNLAEARAIHAAAAASTGVLHIGFNHRHHPAIRRAAGLVRDGAVGDLISIRARYGHGGRPGLEREWRSDPDRAGGGELLDQGVHLADLIHWLAGMPTTAFAQLQTAVWRIEPLEDNAYGLLRLPGGAIAQLHVSMTQWQNLFSFEVHGSAGAVVVEGLGGSYGVERLIRVQRARAGGAPDTHEERFEAGDRSWTDEWEAFIGRVLDPAAPAAGTADDGLAAMRIIDALYRSAASGAAVPL